MRFQSTDILMTMRIQKVLTLLAAVSVLFGASPVLAWTGPAPGASAPDQNVSAPVNTSSASQGKIGYFGIGVSNPLAPLQVGSELSFSGYSYPSLAFNAYYDTSWHYLASGDWASVIQQDSQNGGLLFESAPKNAGSAGTAATLTKIMTVSASGVIGTTGDVCIYNTNGTKKICMSDLVQ